VPAATGQEIELSHRAETYRLRVFAIGNWRYRTHLDGRVVDARLREGRAHAATLELGGRTLRVLHDATESHLRVEIEGHAQRFGWETAGHVRAGTPALVIAIQVAAGERVEAGQPLGLLEAMKMEIAFRAPVSGTITEVCVRRGQQVAADEILLKIDPTPDARGEANGGERLRLPEEPDPLDHFFGRVAAGDATQPDLAAAAGLEREDRRRAVSAARDEIYRLLLGYDANPERVEKLVSVLEAPLPETLSEAFRRELFEIRHELALFADVEQLFTPAPSTVDAGEGAGELRPSNVERLRMYVRRMRAAGAGIAEEFLDPLRVALTHYGVSNLAYGDALERAVLRLLATRGALERRQRLAMAIVRRLVDLARTGLSVGPDPGFEGALARIEAMRGQVPNALADAATEARYTLFEAPELERETERSAAGVDSRLAAIELVPGSQLDPALLELADAPRGVFDRVGQWVSSPDSHRRSLALGAHLVRRYCPSIPEDDAPRIYPGDGIARFEFSDGRVVLGAVPAPGTLLETLRRLCEAADALGGERQGGVLDAIEVLVPCRNDEDTSPVKAAVKAAIASGFAARRLTLGFLPPDGRDDYTCFVPADAGSPEELVLHGLHPETAGRIRLDRYAGFELERLPAQDGTYAFAGRARDVPDDERIFVLTVVRGRPPAEASDASFQLTAFEHAFYEASRTLRNLLSERDPERRLQWNRIALFVAPTVVLDRRTTESITRRLYPATRHLGLEKVLVQVRLAPKRPGLPARRLEAVIADPSGSGMELLWRRPHARPLDPAGAYERKVVQARRRNLVYPYEIVRMLCGSQPGGAGSLDQKLPRGRFEEYDLDPATLCAVPVERDYGMNACGVVLGMISTPTEKIPEGMRRVLLLSDPTRGMGSLGPPECDRVIAAIDLAERLQVPLEWVPVSSGARIAMDSGTENLDATARVVRRIVTFTQAGGVIHVIVNGVNVGAQSYWDALATMLMHTRGALIMTPNASMVLTGSAALEASGGVSAEDEIGIGGFERVMGPSGQAQYFARDLEDAYRILYEHYGYTYVVPGQCGTQAPVRDARPDARSRGYGRRWPRALAIPRRRRDGDRLGRAPGRPSDLPDRNRESKRSARGLPADRRPGILDRRDAVSDRFQEGGAGAQQCEWQPSRRDSREPLRLRWIARVDAAPPAGVRSGNRSGGRELRWSHLLRRGLALPRRRLRRLLSRAQRRPARVGVARLVRFGDRRRAGRQGRVHPRGPRARRARSSRKEASANVATRSDARGAWRLRAERRGGGAGEAGRGGRGVRRDPHRRARTRGRIARRPARRRGAAPLPDSRARSAGPRSARSRFGALEDGWPPSRPVYSSTACSTVRIASKRSSSGMFSAGKKRITFPAVRFTSTPSSMARRCTAAARSDSRSTRPARSPRPRASSTRSGFRCANRRSSASRRDPRSAARVASFSSVTTSSTALAAAAASGFPA
jgi:biotin carboxyl carrier protein